MIPTLIIGFFAAAIAICWLLIAVLLQERNRQPLDVWPFRLFSKKGDHFVAHLYLRHNEVMQVGDLKPEDPYTLVYLRIWGPEWQISVVQKSAGLATLSGERVLARGMETQTACQGAALRTKLKKLFPSFIIPPKPTP